MSVAQLRKIMKESERIAVEDEGAIMYRPSPVFRKGTWIRDAESVAYQGPIWRFRDAEGFTFSVRAEIAIEACKGDEKLSERYLGPVYSPGATKARKAPKNEVASWCFGGKRYSQRYGAASVVVTDEPGSADTLEPSEIEKATRIDGWIVDGAPIGDLPPIDARSSRVNVRLAGCVLEIGDPDTGSARQQTTDNREFECAFDVRTLRALATAAGARGAMVGLARVNEAMIAIVVHGPKGVAVLGQLSDSAK